VTLCTLDNHGR